MLVNKINLEIFILDNWYFLGTVMIQNPEKGIASPSKFEFSMEYLNLFGEHIGKHNLYSPSVRYPLNFEIFLEKNWPSFLLDLIPSGAARDYWLKKFDLKNNATSDLVLLQKGAINPPGNVRVELTLEMKNELKNKSDIGFKKSDIISRGPDFIEYAESMGALISGSSGAQGESPKFLLVQDKKNKWYCDLGISDCDIKKNWLVKYPRGKKKSDYQILKAEAAYYKVAKYMGVKVYGPLTWTSDTLFIPRFDRLVNGKNELRRQGLESLVSALGVSEFGAIKKMEDYIMVINQYSSKPIEDIFDFIFRDFLNIVMGNTDNHGRNSAFLKNLDGTVRLSPLYDFAPMVLDDAGIPRTTKWKNEEISIPKFSKMVDFLQEIKISKEITNDFLMKSYKKLLKLKDFMKKAGVEKEVILLATGKYKLFMQELEGFLNDK